MVGVALIIWNAVTVMKAGSNPKNIIRWEIYKWAGLQSKLIGVIITTRKEEMLVCISDTATIFTDHGW